MGAKMWVGMAKFLWSECGATPLQKSLLGRQNELLGPYALVTSLVIKRSSSIVCETAYRRRHVQHLP